MEENYEQVRELVREKLESGDASGYGDVYATSHMKAEAPHLLIPGQHVKRALREVDPEGVEHHRMAKNRKRGRYVVPGPNALWSADGHDKLAEWGFQIYGIIDAHSRYIIHVFVGLSNRTMIAVLVYYLMAVGELGEVPERMRTDKGAEVLLMAEAQVHLREAEEGQELEVRKCFIFGPSTRNTEIEFRFENVSSLAQVQEIPRLNLGGHCLLLPKYQDTE